MDNWVVAIIGVLQILVAYWAIREARKIAKIETHPEIEVVKNVWSRSIAFLKKHSPLISILSIGFFGLGYQMRLETPFTRLDVLMISVQVGVLLMSITMQLFYKVLREDVSGIYETMIVGRSMQQKITEQLLSNIIKLAENDENIVRALKDFVENEGVGEAEKDDSE